MTNTPPFANLIGQQNLKSTLSFNLEAHKAGMALPHFLFVGAYGFGKSRFVREFAARITDSGKKGSYVELNSSRVKSVQWFVDQVYNPYIQGRENSVIFFDESHALPKEVQTWFLTVLNTEKSPVRRITHDDTELVFDFTKISIHFATTDENKMLKPLKSRMEKLTFENYSQEDLARIIEINCPEVSFEDNVLEELVNNTKPYPRAVEATAEKVRKFCLIKGRKFFNSEDLVNLSRIISIRPFGLDNIEVKIMKLLAERGPMSLTELSACLRISSSAIRQDHEHSLLDNGFLKIDVKRMLSSKGKEVVKNLK